ncbi:hypothetical protein AVEN_78879-1 [Araneus ventricosus]|uniref:RING-type domain-containing protein n=1 Tax=Araneus ventricosus TaxID=182803 RepID=A0A4Y2G3P8_ARAVE|nr:hypothetical protein AVEN_78879-1 [Araneus ventricosus]
MNLEEIICVLCNKNWEYDDFVRGWPCSHKAHIKCIKKWSATLCFVCRNGGRDLIVERESLFMCMKCGELEDGEGISVLDCTHRYHTVCLQTYQKKLCPGCHGIRNAITDEGRIYHDRNVRAAGAQMPQGPRRNERRVDNGSQNVERQEMPEEADDHRNKRRMNDVDVLNERREEVDEPDTKKWRSECRLS